MAQLPEREVYAKTLFAEPRGEIEQGQIWVAWVIKNRARMSRSYWGGSTIKGVCLKPGQFECWNNKNDIHIPRNEEHDYQKIRRLTDRIYDEPNSNDPTGGADHYYNPNKVYRTPEWTTRCTPLQKIGNHQFYKGP